MKLRQEQLKRLLHYDQDTGQFTWLVTRGRTARAGLMAGHTDKYGYRVITLTVDGHRAEHGAHRLAWLYAHGSCPAELDHRNGVKDDNRLCNLRPASRRENMRNKPKYRNNTTGFKGVCFKKSKGRYLASCTGASGRVHIGYFTTAEEAAHAYDKTARELFGEFARTNF